MNDKVNAGMNSNRRIGKYWTLIASALAAVLLAFAGTVPAAPPASTTPQMIQVEIGTHKLIREPAGVQRVAVGDPSVADVNVVNQKELLVSGKKLGITSLLVWPRNSPQPQEYRIRVLGVQDPEDVTKTDPELGQASIARGASLEGKLPNLLAYRRAKVAATPLKDGVSDSSVVEGEMQVFTEIKIAEVNRTTLQAYGAQFFKNVANTTAGIAPPGTLTSIQNTGNAFTLNSQSGFLPVSEAFNLVFGDATRGFLGVLSVLERKGLARVLAEPSLTSMSGQTATFLAGGEFPVPVNQGQNGSITVEYKEFGVRLSLTPTVLSSQRIALKVAPEVSDLDFNAGIQIGGVAVPALTVRRTDTSIELGDGESFVISGLVSSNVIANVDKVPFLGDIPILGAFFRSVSNQRSEKELIMVVTPRLVRPLAREAKLPPLPGAKYDDYRPGFGSLLVGETGEFDSSSFGFSR
ncbi:MAG: type II and III secretion system protein family protein [Panacagrimonas sp.]